MEVTIVGSTESIETGGSPKFVKTTEKTLIGLELSPATAKKLAQELIRVADDVLASTTNKVPNEEKKEPSEISTEQTKPTELVSTAQLERAPLSIRGGKYYRSADGKAILRVPHETEVSFEDIPGNESEKPKLKIVSAGKAELFEEGTEEFREAREKMLLDGSILQRTLFSRGVDFRASIGELETLGNSDLKDKQKVEKSVSVVDNIITGTIGKLIELSSKWKDGEGLGELFQGKLVESKLFLLDKWAEDQLEGVMDLVVKIAKATGLESMRFGAWSGPQGTGKDTNLKAVKAAVADFLKEYDEKNIPYVMTDFVSSFAGEAGTIKTGKDGMFLQPLGIYAKIFGKMPELTKDITDNGAYVGDAFTGVFTYLMVIRNILEGKSSIQIDLYPRTAPQIEQLSKLAKKLRHADIQVVEDQLDLELYNKADVVYIEGNRDEFAKDLKVASSKMGSTVKGALVKIQENLKSDTPVSVKQLPELGYGFDKQVKYFDGLVEELKKSESRNDVIIASGLGKALERVKARRLSAKDDSELRDDDYPLALLNRLASSARASADFIKAEVEIVSTNDAPENVIEAIVKKLLPNAVYDHPAIKSFIKIARQKAIEEVGGKKELANKDKSKTATKDKQNGMEGSSKEKPKKSNSKSATKAKSQKALTKK